MHKPTLFVELRRFIGRGAGVGQLEGVQFFKGNALFADITERESCGVVQKWKELGF